MFFMIGLCSIHFSTMFFMIGLCSIHFSIQVFSGGFNVVVARLLGLWQQGASASPSLICPAILAGVREINR